MTSRGLITPLVFFGSVTNAFAASGQDASGFFLSWALLVFAGLIVVGVALPALLVLFGLTKNISKKESATFGSE